MWWLLAPAVDNWADHRTSLWTVGCADSPVDHRSPATDALRMDNKGTLSTLQLPRSFFHFPSTRTPRRTRLYGGDSRPTAAGKARCPLSCRSCCHGLVVVGLDLRLDHTVTFGVEGDGSDRRPVSGGARPARRVAFAGLEIQRVALNVQIQRLQGDLQQFESQLTS